MKKNAPIPKKEKSEPLKSGNKTTDNKNYQNKIRPNSQQNSGFGAASPQDVQLTPENIIYLQRTVGNRAVTNLISNKLDNPNFSSKGGNETTTPESQNSVTLGTAPTQSSMRWETWQLTADGQEYNRLQTRLEGTGYRFLSKVRSDSGIWESRYPSGETPANRVGWSIGSPDGYWSWATTANVVTECERISQLRPVNLGQPISRAREEFYNIDVTDLTLVSDHFPVDNNGDRWAGETNADIVGVTSLTPVREGNILIVRNIPWRIDCVVLLPKWNNLLRASDAERQEWARFMRRLRVHEQGHVDLAYDFIQQIAPQDRQVTGATLPDIQQNLQVLGTTLQNGLQAQHDNYDIRTNHGATQGAVIRPPTASP